MYFAQGTIRDEGKTRERKNSETEREAELLDRGYIVFERYETRKKEFVRFNTLQYKFMAAFGAETKEIFTECNKILSSIMLSGNMLATHFWLRQDRDDMGKAKFQGHLDEMFRHEGIFWDSMDEKDEIRQKLQAVQDKLDSITKPCFEESMKTYSIFTKPWSEWFSKD